MCQHSLGIEQWGEHPTAAAEVLDPNRGVDEDHRGGSRRRGGAFRLGLLPPKSANRRAASRSTSAFSPRLTNSDFSLIPVYSWAAASNSSSRVTVVRMAVFR